MKKGLLDFLQAASNEAAGAVSAPVDLLAWGLRQAGVPVPENALLSSDWMAQQGLTKPVQPGAAQVAGATVGLLSPVVAAAKAPQIARGLLQAGENAAAPRTLGTQRGVLNVGLPERVKAFETAQKNAAKPVSEGGLGLRADNTAAERARAMGFDTDVYHGGTNDFSAFQGARPTYATDEPRIADIYANATGRHLALREVNAAPNVMPLKLSGKELTVSDLGEGGHGWFPDNLAAALGVQRKRTLVNELPQHGYDRLKVTNMTDLGGEQVQHMIPAGSPHVRSRFAAFDPARRSEADLLGGADPALLALLGLGASGAAYFGGDR
jgi:hypothetical protein